MLEKIRTWWNGLPDKKVVVTVPVKWAVAGSVGVLLLTLALTGARRVEAQFGDAPATAAQVEVLNRRISAMPLCLRVSSADSTAPAAKRRKR